MKIFLFASLLALAHLTTFGQEAPERISLWANHAPIGGGKFQDADATITVYRAAKPNGAAFVICPGGGYVSLMTSTEGRGIAQWLNGHGITGVLLEYRFPKGNAAVPLLDAQRAIRTVRARAAQWSIDPQRIGIMGFSAGGHLASTAGTHFDAGDPKATEAIEQVSCRPDFMVLVYPVITLIDKGRPPSQDSLPGKNATPEDVRQRRKLLFIENLFGKDATPERLAMLSNETRVTRETPPAFLTHPLDDYVVPVEHSRMFYAALQAAGVEARYLELPSGGHGLDGQKGPMWDAWQTQSLAWLAAEKFIPAPDAAPPK